jgi:transposase-like protein
METIATALIEKKRAERGRKITPRGEREALVRAYEHSGLTQKAFAQREGIAFSTFVSWVQTAGRSEQTPKVRFTELTAPLKMPPAPVALEVHLSDGTILRGGTAEQLAHLLRLLRC